MGRRTSCTLLPPPPVFLSPHMDLYSSLLLLPPSLPPPTPTSLLLAPKLASVDTRQEANLTLLVTWELAYDGGYPISEFTITITSESPRAKRQEGGVVYHVDPSAGQLLSQPLPSGQRHLVTLTLENQVGIQDYSLSGKRERGREKREGGREGRGERNE